MSHERHLTIQNLGLLQRQAGVDPEVAELVVAYGRLLVDAGQRLQFEAGPFPSGCTSTKFFANCVNPTREVISGSSASLAAWNGAMEGLNRKPIIHSGEPGTASGNATWGTAAIIERRSAYYRKKEIPKRNGGLRVIHVPRTRLRSIQNWILRLSSAVLTRRLRHMGLPAAVPL